MAGIEREEGEFRKRLKEEKSFRLRSRMIRPVWRILEVPDPDNSDPRSGQNPERHSARQTTVRRSGFVDLLRRRFRSWPRSF